MVADELNNKLWINRYMACKVIQKIHTRKKYIMYIVYVCDKCIISFLAYLCFSKIVLASSRIFTVNFLRIVFTDTGEVSHSFSIITK